MVCRDYNKYFVLLKNIEENLLIERYLLYFLD